MYDERIAVDVNHDRSISAKTGFDGTPCERYVSTKSILLNRRILTSEENEDQYCDAHNECHVHPRNRYVLENELTQAEVVERLAAIGES